MCAMSTSCIWGRVWRDWPVIPLHLIKKGDKTMAHITLGDLLSFAKAGYSPKDVKELLSMEIPETKKAEGDEQEVSLPDPEENVKEQKTEETILQNDSTSNQESEGNKIIDYKLKYEQAQETIKKLQEQNTHKDISGEGASDPMGSFDDILRSMM